MKKFLLAFFLIFALLPAHAHAASAKFEISGWLPYWRAATSTADVAAHLQYLTEINPFGYTVKTDGTLYDAMGVDQEPWASLIATAKAKKVRVIPTVMWSNAEAIHRILSNTTTRRALEDAITALVKEKGFDGIDIDFENKKSETKPYFSLFLKGLYQRMGNKWVTCDIEPRTPLSSRYEGTPPKDATDYANDYVQINKYCDRVHVMAYDQGAIDVRLNAARAAPYIPLSDPAWVEKVITLTAQTISKKKLVIGIPTYGYEYSVTPLSQSGYRYDLQWAFNPRYGTDLATQLGVTPLRNSSNELSFIYKPSTNVAVSDPTEHTQDSPFAPAVTLYSQAAIAAQITPPFNVVWWSDATAIADKVALAHKLGVRGIAIFKFDGGEDPNMWNILK